MSNLSWDSAIENDGSTFEILQPGRVRFKVEKFERASSTGEKTRGAPMARLELKLTDANGKMGSARETLVLHTSTEWKLAEFFRAIGQRKHGEKVRPDWSKVLGASGECDIVIEKWTKQDGTEGESNKVKRFLDPVEGQPVKPKTDDDSDLPF